MMRTSNGNMSVLLSLFRAAFAIKSVCNGFVGRSLEIFNPSVVE